jgi:hypothetical protein
MGERIENGKKKNKKAGICYYNLGGKREIEKCARSPISLHVYFLLPSSYIFIFVCPSQATVLVISQKIKNET